MPNASIESRLKELGITLPQLAMPAANYVPYVRSGSLLVVSGQLPFIPGGIDPVGVLGTKLTAEQAQPIARQCALNVLACAAHALDNRWENLVRLVRLGVFVASTPTFTDQPLVANGASDLMVEVLGDAGRHARAAVGVSALPKGVAVEVEAMFEVR